MPTRSFPGGEVPNGLIELNFLGEFRDRFQPNFELHAIEKESFSELARQTPTVYYVQSGVIKHVQVNNVMSAARFYEETLAEID